MSRERHMARIAARNRLYCLTYQLAIVALGAAMYYATTN